MSASPTTSDIQRAIRLSVARVVADPSDLAAPHILLLFPLRCLALPLARGRKGFQETRARHSRFLADDEDVLQQKQAARARAYAARLLARGPAKSTSLVRARLRRARTLARMGELSRAARALELSAPAPSRPDTLAALRSLRPLATWDLPLFVTNFVPDEVFPWTRLLLRRRSFAPRSSLPVGQAASCSNTYAMCSTLLPRGTYTACSLS